ncbi:MAG TPA: Ku protein [Noviherbaspirillum sp.]|nr:Ku protein [Noviherbaspirillum sp.]
MNLPEEKLHHPHARPTHAVDILAFVEAQEIPPDCYETPYTLAPAPGGEKVYALLCETLRNSGKVGIAFVVIQSRQHLAAVVPQGQSLVLNTLRWTRERDVPADADPSGDDAIDLAAAREMSLMAPLPAGSRTGAMLNRSLFQTAGAALEENKMKAKKSDRIIVEELEGLLDDDELIDDDYLASILGRRMHPPDGHAMRRAQTPRRFHRLHAPRKRG